MVIKPSPGLLPFGEHAYYLAATDNDKFVSTDEL